MTREAPPPTRAAVESALPALTGWLEQVPPAYSAKRIDGRRAYDLARAGVAVEMRPARVRVDAWELLAWREPAGDAATEARVRITCGGGTYIRSLARDLGRLTGSAAHLTELRRTGSGAFDVRDAVPLDVLRDRAVTLRPAREAVPHWPEQRLDEVDVRRVTGGNLVGARVEGPWAALVDDASGRMIALAERAGERWQPRVVLHG